MLAYAISIGSKIVFGCKMEIYALEEDFERVRDLWNLRYL